MEIAVEALPEDRGAVGVVAVLRMHVALHPITCVLPRKAAVVFPSLIESLWVIQGELQGLVRLREVIELRGYEDSILYAFSGL